MAAEKPKTESLGTRFEAGTRARLDTWLEDLNQGRRVPIKRSTLLQGLVAWAIENRPDWESAKQPGGPGTGDA